jgi:uncharacterized protein YdaU (DUF1376 family)
VSVQRKRDSRPFLPLFPGDYHRDTQHLEDAAEHGAYLLLMMSLWSRGGFLPDDQTILRRVAKVKPARWPSVWAMIGPLFTVTDDAQITHGRILSELDYVTSTSEVRSKVGAKGGHAKALKTKKPAVANGKQLSGKALAPNPQVLEVALSELTSNTPDRPGGDLTAAGPAGGQKRMNEMTREERRAVLADVLGPTWEDDARRRRRG